jgi:YD repeat-containing protein
MKRLVLLLLVACSAPAVKRLPGASTTPVLGIARTSRSCGYDVSRDGTSPYVRYVYAYDPLGRIARATGQFAAGGPDDHVDYTYDHLDHMTHVIETRGGGSDMLEQIDSFDTLGDLVEYTLDQHGLGYNSSTQYTYSDLTASGQPKLESIVDNGSLPARYLLTYDATDRLVAATLTGGATTTYTYDDDQGRTLTVDTDNGAFHGVYIYDDQDRELSETWGGTDPSATASATTYDYADDLLSTITYQQAATTADPLVTVEVDTMRYACDTP